MLLFEAIKQFSAWRQFNVKPHTVSGYEADLRILCLYLHNPYIQKVGLDDILNHLKEMRAYGWDDNTFIRKCTAFKKFFQFFKKQGFQVLDPDLIPIPAKQYKLPRVADEVNYQKLLSVIPRDDNSRSVRNLALLNMLWDTGARNGEVCSLNCGDLDLTEMKAVVRTEKNRGSRPFREIFWTPPTNENLKRWMWKRENILTRAKKPVEAKDPEALFISLGTGKAGERLNVKGVGEVLRRYSNQAKLPYTLNAHSFRHHMGHDLVKNGFSNSDVAGILGHSSLESSFIYTMLNNDELHDRYKKLKGD